MRGGLAAPMETWSGLSTQRLPPHPPSLHNRSSNQSLLYMLSQPLLPLCGQEKNGFGVQEARMKNFEPFYFKKTVCFILIKKINVPFGKYERLEYRGE